MGQSELIARSGKSNDALAKEVLARWEKRAPRDSKPSPRSLGTYVGNLRSGKTEWWLKRKTPTRILAEILECDPAALLTDEHASAGSMVFEDFSQLAPLRADERTPLTEWLTDNIRRWVTAVTPSCTWLVAPPGAGKRTAVRQLRLALGNDAVVLEVVTLLEAARDPRLAGGVAAIVLVARREARTDALAFEELTRRGGVTVVVAAFSPPGSAGYRWSVEAPCLPLHWRRHLCEWVSSRVGSGGPSVDDCRELFSLIDPRSTCIVTPGDAMPLLAWMHGGGAGVVDPPLVEIADALVHDRLGRSGCPRPLIPRACDALKTAVAVALDRQARGSRPATIEDWIDVFSATSIAPTRAKREAAIQALAEAPKKLRAKRRAELEELLDADPTGLSEALIQARLLVEADLGRRPADVVEEVFAGRPVVEPGPGFDIYPRIVRRAYERAAVDEAAASGNWRRLGRWAAAPAVRPIVIDALLRRDRRELIRLAERLLAADTRDLSWAALAEALFEAIGEQLTPELSGRPARKFSADDASVLVALGEVQAGLVSIAARARGSEEPTRLTASPPNWSPENAGWLMRAWGYSLAVPPPRLVPEHAGWAFPGWLPAAPPDAWLPSVPSRREVPDDVWRVFVGQLAVARRLVREHPVVVGDEAPTIIQAAAIIEGISTERLRDPRRNSTDAVIAALVADEKDAVARSTIAARVWSSFARAPKHDPVLALHQVGALREFLVDALPPDAFLDGLDVDQVVETMSRRGQIVDTLPDRLLEPLFAFIAPTLVSRQHAPSVSLPDVIARLKSIDTLITLLSGRFSLPPQAAARLWVLDPGLALAELERRLSDQPESAACLILESPASYAEAVVALVRVPPPSLAVFLPRWLAERAALGNADADLLFDTLTTQPEFALAVSAPPSRARPKESRRS
jgi:hypothetical protein